MLEHFSLDQTAHESRDREREGLTGRQADRQAGREKKKKKKTKAQTTVKETLCVAEGA